MEKIYSKLAAHLDNLPGGFPPSDSGVEFRILKRLFSPEEAALAIHLTLIPEVPEVVARRAGVSVQAVAGELEKMARKGLIYRIEPSGKPVMYMATQYVIGIWEFHVNDLDEQLARDMDEYMPTLIKESWKKPQLRTIPVNKSINHELIVMTYENAEELVRDVKKAVVAPCICHREHSLLGNSCDKPEETCLVFNTAANFYLSNGLGREIDKVEVLDILERAERAGLVLQPNNARKVSNICCCCGDCCGVLRHLKADSRPARYISSPFFALSDPEICSGCGICIDRCQMEAIQLVDGKASIHSDRCIGCGLCVSTCPTASMKLVRKAESDQPQVPRDAMQAGIELGRSRGKLSSGKLAMMKMKSKADRLMRLKK